MKNTNETYVIFGNATFDEIRKDFQEGKPIWREVSERMFWEALGAVPPVDQCGGRFMMGEAYDIKDKEYVYYGFVYFKDKYFSRIMKRSEFELETRRLKDILIDTKI